MCKIEQYERVIEKEIELTKSGHITAVVEVKLDGYDNRLESYRYKMEESKRTNCKFTDIIDSLAKQAENGNYCYQVPGNEIPKTVLLDENRLQICKVDKKNRLIWLRSGFNGKLGNNPVKSGHLLCVPPSTGILEAELSAIEAITGQTRSSLPLMDRQRFNFPSQIGAALGKILKEEDLQLPKYDIDTIPENEWVVLTDPSRKGNDEQRRFVENALATPDFAVLVGPPGSGKTTCLVELLLQLVKRQKKVMLVASTNVAVDNVLEKIGEHLDKTYAVRYGDCGNSRISSGAKKFIAGKNFRKNEYEELEKRVGDTDNIYRQMMLEYCTTESNTQFYKILEENAPIVAGTTFGAALPELKKLAENTTEPPFDYMILDEASKTTIQEFLVPATLCKHWIIVGDIAQLPPYTDDDYLSHNLQICYPSDYKLRRQYTALSDVLLVAANSNCNQYNIVVEKESDYDTYLYKKYCDENNVLFADADNDEHSDLLPYANIVVGSCQNLEKYRAMLPPHVTTVRLAKDRATDRVLHEEQLQFICNRAKYNRERLFDRYKENQPKEWHNEMSWRLIRRFEQRNNKENTNNTTLDLLNSSIEKMIPKTDPSLEKECKQNIHTLEQIYLPSCMELFVKGFGQYTEIALFRGFPKSVLSNRLTNLSYQHRSHPDIAKQASKEFYDGNAMKSEHMVGKREWQYQQYGSEHNVWIDVKGYCDDKKRNKKETETIVNEIKKFSSFAKKSGKSWTIAVLSFYKEQAESLKDAISKNQLNDGKVKISVGSVDSFQGHEADVVFLSYSNQHPTNFLTSPNRYNVAITRARYMMIHVGNYSQMGKDEGSFGRIIKSIKTIKTINQ